MGTAALLLFLASAKAKAGDWLAAPAPRPGAAWTVAYDHPAPLASWRDDAARLALLAGRCEARVTAVPLATATAADLAAPDLLIVLLEGDGRHLPADAAPAIRARMAQGKPLLVLGPGMGGLIRPLAWGEWLRLGGGLDSAPAKELFWRGALQPLRSSGWLAARLRPGRGSEVIGSFASRDADPLVVPLAWRHGSAYFYAGLPDSADADRLISDLLLSAGGAAALPPTRSLLVISDFAPASDPAGFRRIVDVLRARNIPFAVGAVVPDASADPALSGPWFLDLHYATARGGGCLVQIDARTAGDPRAAVAAFDQAAARLKAEHIPVCGVRLAGTPLTPGLATRLAAHAGTVVAAEVAIADGLSADPLGLTSVVRHPSGLLLVPENVTPATLTGLPALRRLQATSAAAAVPAGGGAEAVLPVATALSAGGAVWIDPATFPAP